MNRFRTTFNRPGTIDAPGRLCARWAWARGHKPHRRDACATVFVGVLCAKIACGMGGCAADACGEGQMDAASVGVFVRSPVVAHAGDVPLAEWVRAAPTATQFADARGSVGEESPKRLWRVRESVAWNGASIPAPRADMWAMRRGEADAVASAPDEWAASTDRFAMRDDGAVTLVSTTEPADRVTTWFDPPMLVVPATLAVGAAVTQSFEMIVRPIDKPEQVQTRGPAEITITHEGFESVRTPAGSWVAARVRTDLKATLAQAKVTVKTYSWIAEGVGLVAEEYHERVTVFGLPIRNVQRRWAIEQR